ncbi:MAG: aldehyde dehydrogenase family protein, partial [Pseudomonadales bacterium]
MQRFEKLYIDGAWQRADAESLLQVVNPATEEPMFEVVQANVCDAQRAIAAAHRAFPAWSRSSAQWRRELMLAIADQIQQRYDDFAMAHVQMMGCPVSIVGAYQVDAA